MEARVSTLANGLRVVSYEMPHLETVSLGAWIAAGSRNERPEQHGIAHFLEHMAFKGTTTRSAYEIVETIENVGGDLNASTGLDQTSYYAVVMRSDVELAVSLLGDILQNPSFEEDELLRERDVILQEILASEDQPDDVVFDLAQSLAFKDQSVGRPVMGTTATVSSFIISDLTDFMKTHYRAENMVLSAAGAIKHDEFVQFAETYFSQLLSGHLCSLEKITYTGGMAAASQEFEQGHVVISFKGVAFKSSDIFTMQIISSALGGGMSSRLFQEVREKRGLAYHVYSFHSSYEDAGLFGLYVACDKKRQLEATEVMLNEIATLCESGLNLTELNRAKAQLKSSLAMSLESSAVRAEQLARQILFFNRVIPVSELIEEIDAVTLEMCQDLMKRVVSETEPTIALVGGGQNIDEFKRFKCFFDTSDAC
ncbi:MAG: insulinase family protein [Rhizobiales bacterium]|nr:insulinase family protein [Hyphomicrobiales bacterium]